VRFPKFIAPRTRVGRSPVFFFGITSVIGILLVACFAFGHTPGVSTCDFDVASDGRVEARFVFASTEPLRSVRLDRDGDGVVTEDEVIAARDELRAFIVGGVDVAADGVRCPATFDGAEIREADGLVLTASFACPAGPARLEATLYYLSDLRADHREVARITAASSTEEAVLTRDRRQIVLALPGAGARQATRRNGRRGAIRLVALLALGLGFGLHAWLRGRRPAT
jgi:hypothetical protein